MTDEETFQRVFGGCDFAIMCIVAQGNQTYARITFNAGPGGCVMIPVEVDYTQAFEASNHKSWDQELRDTVQEDVGLHRKIEPEESIFGSDAVSYHFMEELEHMDVEERQMYLDELAERPDLWDQEEVMYL